MTSISTAVTETSHLYQLEFLQESNSPYESLLIPWAVVLDGEMVVQPSDATMPASGTTDELYITSNSSYSAIWFSVPNGTYSYSILPVFSLGSEQSGNVTIDGSNVQVQVYAFVRAMGCSSSSILETASSALVTPNVTTTTQASSSVPSWAYALMAILLVAGLAVGYVVRVTHRRSQVEGR